MRSRLKQIGTTAVIAALTVAGLSVASGGGGGDKQSSDSAGTRATFAVDGANGNGNVIRERKHRRWRGDFADADVRAVLDDIRDAVAKQAPDIAGPVIDKAEKDGKITADQAAKLRQAAQDIADGKRPDIRGLGRDADVQDVIHDAFAAAHDKVPGIAEPIIKKAVDDKQITEAQADRIREMVRRGPPPGRGPHGPGFGGPPKIARQGSARGARGHPRGGREAGAGRRQPRDRQGRAGRQDHRRTGRPAARGDPLAERRQAARSPAADARPA